MASTETQRPPLLDAELVKTYRKEGVVKLPRLLSVADLKRLQDVCTAVFASKDQTVGLAGQRDGKGSDVYGYQSHPNYKKMWSNEFDLRLRHPELKPLIARYARAVSELLGDDDPRLLWDKTFTKPSVTTGTRQTVWHQDLPQVPVDRRGLLTVWIAVWDVPEEAGAMRFVPRSKMLGPLGRVDFIGNEHTVESLMTEEDKEIVGEPFTIPLKAGEATVHDGLTLHGAGPNNSPKPRVGWTLLFVPGKTVWTGNPWPQTDMNEMGMKPYQTIDHPRFRVNQADYAE